MGLDGFGLVWIGWDGMGWDGIGGMGGDGMTSLKGGKEGQGENDCGRNGVAEMMAEMIRQKGGGRNACHCLTIPSIFAINKSTSASTVAVVKHGVQHPQLMHKSTNCLKPQHHNPTPLQTYSHQS